MVRAAGHDQSGVFQSAVSALRSSRRDADHMSHAVRLAATRTSSPPPASAAVLHFNCLYTHDLRRKHKRWQDGQLKFHTFNEKYMLYNDGGGFVGDGHWSGDQANFCEGLELSLDRGAAIVQVDRCTGRTEQDLSQILDKRAREVEARRLNALSRVPATGARPPNPGGVVGGAPHIGHTVQQRPLNSLVSNPGPIGRASLPECSPFEERKALSSDRPRDPIAAQRPASERRRLGSPPSKEGHAQKLFGTKLTLVNTPFPSRSIPPISHVKERSSTGNSDRKTGSRVEKHDALSSSQELCPRATSATSHRNRAEKPDANDSHATPRQLRVHDTENEEDSSHEPTQKHRSPKPQQSPLKTQEKRRRMVQKIQSVSIRTRNHTEVAEQQILEENLVALIPGDGESEDDGNRPDPMLERFNEERKTRAALGKCPEAKIAPSQKREGSRMHEEENRKSKKQHHGLEEEIRGHKQASGMGKSVKHVETTNAAATGSSSNPPTERRIQLRSKSKPKRGLLIMSEISARSPGVNGGIVSDKAEPIARVNPQKIPEYEAEVFLPVDEPEGSTGTRSSQVGTKRKRREVEEESGPQMKRMARKSVKSKEIFGLKFPANDPIPSPFVSLVDALRAGPGYQMDSILPVRAADSPRPAREEKEAAGDDDADGPVSQCVPPCVPVAVRPDAVPPEASVEIDIDFQSKSSVSRNAGFKSLAVPSIGGAGAWSRHAEDLLGMTRPLTKARHR